MYKILFIEDNDAYREKIASILRENNYFVDTADNPILGIQLFAKNKYDLVISDLMMSQMDGLVLISTLKGINPNIKTVILTGEPTDDTELSSIELHVDKYLVKESSIKVLLKYVKIILEKEGSVIHTGEQKLESRIEKIIMYLSSRTVYKNGELVDVTRKEFEVLKYFLENKGVALSREVIIETLWNGDIEQVDTRAIDVHIKKLRAKLNLFSIMSVRGYGYKWNE